MNTASKIRELVYELQMAAHSVKLRKERLDKLAELKGVPQVILDNERRMLELAKERHSKYKLAIAMYKEGVCDGLRKNTEGMEILKPILSPEERLIYAIFGMELPNEEETEEPVEEGDNDNDEPISED